MQLFSRRRRQIPGERPHVLVLLAVFLLPNTTVFAGHLVPIHKRASHLLYRANWQTGLHRWSTWGGRWWVKGGVLSFHDRAMSSILSPFRPTTTHYAIVARMRVVNYLADGIWTANMFGILCTGSGSRYKTHPHDLGAGVLEYKSASSLETSSSAILTDPKSPQLEPALGNNAPFSPGKRWHTYRLEVDGRTTVLIIDGEELVRVHQQPGWSVGGVGLFSNTTAIQVTDFEVISR